MQAQNNKFYVIGDIHGCANSLNKLLFDKLDISNNTTLLFLGDYIDRGPASKDVLDILINLSENKQINTIFLRGNHEQLMLESYFSRKMTNIWKKNQGESTLKSFGESHPTKIDKKYYNFLTSTKFFHTNDDFVFVHAGLDFDIHNPLEDTSLMLWIRNKDIEIDTNKINKRRIVVGHTPVSIETIKNSLYKNKIMLDGGCVYKNEIPHLGNLAALEINSMELTFQRNIDE